MEFKYNGKVESVELNKYSKTLTQDPTQPATQAMYYGIGFKDEDFKKSSGRNRQHGLGRKSM